MILQEAHKLAQDHELIQGIVEWYYVMTVDLYLQ
jgi:hypothetical protein